MKRRLLSIEKDFSVQLSYENLYLISFGQLRSCRSRPDRRALVERPSDFRLLCHILVEGSPESTRRNAKERLAPSPLQSLRSLRTRGARCASSTPSENLLHCPRKDSVTARIFLRKTASFLFRPVGTFVPAAPLPAPSTDFEPGHRSRCTHSVAQYLKQFNTNPQMETVCF